MVTELQPEQLTPGEIERERQLYADFEQRRDLLDDNREDFLREHPNEWVAIPQGGVPLFAPSADELRDKLMAGNHNLGEVVTAYLDPEPTLWIL